jgi:glucosamine-6-phosphate deaminase
MNITVFESHEAMSREAARLVIEAIRKKPDLVVCFPTGGTPERLYELLVEEYKAGDVDFSKVKVRSVDDYVGLTPDNDQSYAYYLHHRLFSHCNFNPDNIELINSCAKDLDSECRRYNQKLKDEGGIDLILDGIGENGHIGFNEPSDHLYERFHVEKVSEWTRQVNARFFKSLDDVPTEALTVGVLDLLQAKTFLVLSSGMKKAKAWNRLCSEPYLTTEFPASFLKLGRNVKCLIDKESASLIPKE